MAKIETSKFYSTEIKHFERYTEEAIKDLSIRENLLLADVLGKKKGELYQDVLASINATFPIGEDGKRTNGFTNMYDFIAKQFPEYPSEPATVEGKAVRIILTKTVTQKRASNTRDPLYKGDRLTEDEMRAWSAVNSFLSWESGERMAVERSKKSEEINKKVADKLAAEIAADKEKGQGEWIPSYKAEREKAIRSELVKQAKRDQGPRLVDGSGNFKATAFESLENGVKANFIKEVVKAAGQDEIAKQLSAVTGKPVTYARPLSDISTGDMLTEMRNRLSEFKDTSKAEKLLTALASLWFEEHKEEKAA